MRLYSCLWLQPELGQHALAAMNELGRCDALLDLDSYQSAELRDFIFSFTENASTNPVVEFNTEMNPLNIWDDTLWSSRNISFRIWLPCLVSSLIRAWFSVDGPLSNAFIKSFQCIASLSVDVAEALLPLIIFEASVLGGDLRVRLVEVFTNHLLVPTGSTRAVQLACDTLTFLLRQEINSFSAKKRSQTEKYSHKAGPFFKLLPVDCTIVARAALSCGYHCTALLFTEFGHDAKKTTPDSDLLLSIQLGIHDPDGIFAINSSSLAVQAAQYADSGNWLEAMCAYESLMTNSRQANVSGMGTTQVESYIGLASSLRGLGCESSLHSLAYSLPTEVIKHHAGIAALASESSWRQFEASNHIGDPVRVSKDLSTWSLPSSATNSLSNQADENILFFNHSLSEMLRSTSAPGHASDTVWDKNFQSSGEVLLHQLRFVSTHESARRIIDHLSRAQQIFELKKLKESFHSGRLGKTHNILNTWTNKVTGLTSEPVLALRLTIAKQLLESGIESPEMVTNKAMDLILAAAVSPTASHSLSASVERLRQSVFSSLNKQNSPANEIECVVVRSTWALQEAKFLWKKGLHQTARATIDEDVIAFVKGSSTQTSTSPLADLLSEALRIRGEWAISSKVASGAAIAHQFLYPALEHSVDPVVRSKAAESLGEFNARLYRSIKARVGGLEWQQSEKVRADRRAELERCKIIISTEKEKNSGREASEEFKQLIRHTQVLHKETDMDEKDRRQIISTIHQYLHQAIENLVILLELSPDSNLDQIVQLVNLWLENKRSDDVNSLMRRAVDSVPTFKFIPLTYQIFSRLGDSDDSAADKTFQDVLQRLVYKMCEDHPHHTLWQLFALANADKVTSAAYKSNVSASRCAAATAILSRLRGSGSRQKLQTIVASIESLINSYIVLAEMSVEKYIKSNDIKNIPFRNFYDRSKVSFDSVGQGICPPTLLPRLRPDKDYDDIVRILQFSPTFSITDSGISRPKILEFTSTDYCKHRQLLKSGDDTRQDAVMEQVFEVVNKLLVAQESTRKRQLSIRTYKVVPLTPLIGVLQWVDNTIQFGAYLSDKGTGAHSRYNKFDWHHNDCREHLRNASSDDPNDRVKRMNEIYDRFKPAFKYFFLEHYASPTEWVSRRLAYTRSVAVTSIVGYILGIGDRHSHNILIDTLTAEVVHIDFGIVFDQGKGLSTPESVPFRLTRDIVDGMGIFRTEGAFRKCCEEVMRVLRSNSMALLTVLSVVIHDPLYKWSLSPAAARARQSKDPGPRMRAGQDAMEETGRSQFGRDAGERTLLRIKAKLQGFDDPTGEGLSVEGQVDQLISEAQSIENLSRLFPGWAPWL